MANVSRYLTGSAGNGGGYSRYAAGRKMYGGGRDAPNMGPVDPSGYVNRDAAIKARRNAILRRLQSLPQGQYLQPSRIK